LLAIQAGGTSAGRNGSFFLNATTVHDNDISDTLFGDPTALDWFFTGAGDVVKNRHNGEVSTAVS
jgi:hypothetical protein